MEVDSMSFFKDLGNKITNAAQDASKKTAELIEISKINSSINTEKAAIIETQKVIGAKIYELYAAGEQLPEILNEDLASIADRNQTILNLENKIAEIKAEAERYKAEAEAERARAEAEAERAKAEKLRAEQEAAAQAAGGRACTNCGALLEEGMKFCGQCGTRND
jgi:peptidoglycan hydrolase CwlO-like protein